MEEPKLRRRLEPPRPLDPFATPPTELQPAPSDFAGTGSPIYWEAAQGDGGVKGSTGPQGQETPGVDPYLIHEAAFREQPDQVVALGERLSAEQRRGPLGGLVARAYTELVVEALRAGRTLEAAQRSAALFAQVPTHAGSADEDRHARLLAALDAQAVDHGLAPVGPMRLEAGPWRLVEQRRLPEAERPSPGERLLGLGADGAWLLEGADLVWSSPGGADQRWRLPADHPEVELGPAGRWCTLSLPDRLRFFSAEGPPLELSIPRDQRVREHRWAVRISPVDAPVLDLPPPIPFPGTRGSCLSPSPQPSLPAGPPDPAPTDGPETDGPETDVLPAGPPVSAPTDGPETDGPETDGPETDVLPAPPPEPRSERPPGDPSSGCCFPPTKSCCFPPTKSCSFPPTPEPSTGPRGVAGGERYLLAMEDELWLAIDPTEPASWGVRLTPAEGWQRKTQREAVVTDEAVRAALGRFGLAAPVSRADVVRCYQARLQGCLRAEIPQLQADLQTLCAAELQAPTAWVQVSVDLPLPGAGDPAPRRWIARFGHAPEGGAYLALPHQPGWRLLLLSAEGQEVGSFQVPGSLWAVRPVGTQLLIHTDVTLHVTQGGASLARIATQPDAELLTAADGFGLLSSHLLRWYSAVGELQFELTSTSPILRLWPEDGGLVVMTDSYAATLRPGDA